VTGVTTNFPTHHKDPDNVKDPQGNPPPRVFNINPYFTNQSENAERTAMSDHSSHTVQT